MNNLLSEIRLKLTEKGIKVTPQRLIILEAISKLNNHPTADNIIEHIRSSHPNIAIGTVYKVLETLVENGIIQRVKTDHDIMRYDAIMDKHHHIYFLDSERIEDYFDDELNEMLTRYFNQKNLPDFIIEDIKLQIVVKSKK